MKSCHLIVVLLALLGCSRESFNDLKNLKEPEAHSFSSAFLNSVNFNIEDKDEALQFQHTLHQIKPILVVKNLENLKAAHQHCVPTVGRNITNQQLLPLVKQQSVTDAYHTISLFRFGAVKSLEDSVALICEFDRGDSKTLSDVSKDLDQSVRFYSNLTPSGDFSNDYKKAIESTQTAELNQIDVFAPAYYGAVAKNSKKNENALKPQALILDLNRLIVFSLQPKGQRRCEIVGTVPEDLKRSQKLFLFLHSGSQTFLGKNVFTTMRLSDHENLNLGFKLTIRCEAPYGSMMTFVDVAKELDHTIQFISGKSISM